MNWADIAILVTIAISALISLFRGLVREVLSVVAWVVAFWVAYTFTGRASELLIDYVSVATARHVLAFIILLVVSLLFTGLVNHLIGKLIATTGLSGTDRMLGVIFGVLRGVAVIAVLIFLAGLTPVPRDPWWRQSILLAHFQGLAEYGIGWLPPEFADHFSYD